MEVPIFGLMLMRINIKEDNSNLNYTCEWYKVGLAYQK